MWCMHDSMGEKLPDCTTKPKASEGDILKIWNNLFNAEAVRKAEATDTDTDTDKSLPSDSDFDKGYTIDLTATWKDIIKPNWGDSITIWNNTLTVEPIKYETVINTTPWKPIIEHK